jgi:hypothetical protein
MELVGIIGGIFGIVVSGFEIYNKSPSFLRKSFPNHFDCYMDVDRYSPILNALSQSQKIPRNKRWGARTIPNIYKDIKIMLDSPLYQVGICKSKRSLNLIEFYWLIRNSPDWQPAINDIMPYHKKQECIKNAYDCQSNLTNKELDMITKYYWYLQEIHQENP